MSNITNFDSNLSNRITLRLTDKEFNYLVELANKQGITVSMLIRKIIDSVMVHTATV